MCKYKSVPRLNWLLSASLGALQGPLIPRMLPARCVLRSWRHIKLLWMYDHSVSGCSWNFTLQGSWRVEHQDVHAIIIITFIIIIIWLQYPKKINDSLVALLHPSPSCSTCLQLTIPICLTSFSTYSFHLPLGLPLGRFWCKLFWYIFLVLLASSILSIYDVAVSKTYHCQFDVVCTVHHLTICIWTNKMHKILVIRIYFPLGALHVSDCISSPSGATFISRTSHLVYAGICRHHIPAYTKCDVQLIKAVPDDGLTETETCRAFNGK